MKAAERIDDPDVAEDLAWIRLLNDAEKRLAAKLKEAGLEIPYAPGFDTVLVLREPAPPVQKFTDGGLHIPDAFQEEPEPKSEGVLVGAGLKALDSFRSHGYLVGDRVQIGRFAGWEKEFELDKKGKNKRKILQMTAGDILGSFDLKERLWGKKPSMEVAYDPDTREHYIRPVT